MVAVVPRFGKTKRSPQLARFERYMEFYLSKRPKKKGSGDTVGGYMLAGALSAACQLFD